MQCELVQDWLDSAAGRAGEGEQGELTQMLQLISAPEVLVRKCCQLAALGNDRICLHSPR